jgi:hypothetical protein
MRVVVSLLALSFAASVATAQAGGEQQAPGPHGKDSPKNPNAPTAGTRP